MYSEEYLRLRKNAEIGGRKEKQIFANFVERERISSQDMLQTEVQLIIARLLTGYNDLRSDFYAVWRNLIEQRAKNALNDESRIQYLASGRHPTSLKSEDDFVDQMYFDHQTWLSEAEATSEIETLKWTLVDKYLDLDDDEEMAEYHAHEEARKVMREKWAKRTPEEWEEDNDKIQEKADETFDWDWAHDEYKDYIREVNRNTLEFLQEEIEGQMDSDFSDLLYDFNHFIELIEEDLAHRRFNIALLRVEGLINGTFADNYSTVITVAEALSVHWPGIFVPSEVREQIVALQDFYGEAEEED